MSKTTPEYGFSGKTMLHIFGSNSLLRVVLAFAALVQISCSLRFDEELVVPNLDHRIGMPFENHALGTGRKYHVKIFESEEFEEYESGVLTRCKIVYRVRKVDDVIIGWKIMPSPEECKSRRRPLNM